MSGSILVDTNVLVYAYDRAAPVKQQQSLLLLDSLAVSGAGTLSTQILAEFFTVVTRKLATPLDPQTAYVRLERYLSSWAIFDVTGLIVIEAARGVRDHSFSFWDAQIWATARLNQVSTVFSEDFNSGSTIEGVRFVNPFAVDFKLADWSFSV